MINKLKLGMVGSMMMMISLREQAKRSDAKNVIHNCMNMRNSLKFVIIAIINHRYAMFRSLQRKGERLTEMISPLVYKANYKQVIK